MSSSCDHYHCNQERIEKIQRFIDAVKSHQPEYIDPITENYIQNLHLLAIEAESCLNALRNEVF